MLSTRSQPNKLEFHYRAAYATTWPLCDSLRHFSGRYTLAVVGPGSALEQAGLRHLRATDHRPGRPPELWIQGFMPEFNSFFSYVLRAPRDAT